MQELARIAPVGVHLYIQETRALARGRLLWYGLAAIFLFFLFLFLGPGLRAGSLQGFLFVVYLLVPVGFAPLAAAHIAGPRASRFVQAVFTAPVRRSSYLVAKIAALLTAAAAYFLLTAPFLALHWIHTGVPTIYGTYILAGALLTLFAIGLGSLLGVLFTGRGVAAAVTLSLVPFLTVLAFPFVDEGIPVTVPGSETQAQEPSVEGPPAPTWKTLAFRAIHVGPHVSLMEALNVPPMGLVPSDPARAMILLLVTTAGLIGMASWIFLAHQGVESWSGPPRARAAGIVVALLILALPALAPPMTYEAEDTSYRVSDLGNVVASAALLERGADAPSGFSWGLSAPVPIGSTRPFDLYLALRPGANTDFLSAEFSVYGTGHLEVSGAQGVRFEAAALARGEERHVILLLPVTAGATSGEGLKRAPYELHIQSNVTMTQTEGEAAGSTQSIEDDEFFRVHGEVQGATAKAVLFAAPIPLLLLGIAITRDLRRR